MHGEFRWSSWPRSSSILIAKHGPVVIKLPTVVLLLYYIKTMRFKANFDRNNWISNPYPPSCHMQPLYFFPLLTLFFSTTSFSSKSHIHLFYVYSFFLSPNFSYYWFLRMLLQVFLVNMPMLSMGYRASLLLCFAIITGSFSVSIKFKHPLLSIQLSISLMISRSSSIARLSVFGRDHGRSDSSGSTN